MDTLRPVEWREPLMLDEVPTIMAPINERLSRLEQESDTQPLVARLDTLEALTYRRLMQVDPTGEAITKLIADVKSDLATERAASEAERLAVVSSRRLFADWKASMDASWRRRLAWLVLGR